MVMTGQVKERAALGNFRTPRPGSTDNKEQPKHGAGRGAAPSGPPPRRGMTGGTSAIHPGQHLQTQNHYLLSHPKAVVRRPTCPLGPPLPCLPGQDRTTIPEREGWRAHPAQCPGPRPGSRPLVPPGPQPVTPRTAGPGNSLPAPVKVSLRPDETPKETRVGSGGLSFNTPYPHPGQEGPHSKAAPVMPARGTRGNTHTHFAGCPYRGAWGPASSGSPQVERRRPEWPSAVVAAVL